MEISKTSIEISGAPNSVIRERLVLRHRPPPQLAFGNVSKISRFFSIRGVVFAC